MVCYSNESFFSEVIPRPEQVKRLEGLGINSDSHLCSLRSISDVVIYDTAGNVIRSTDAQGSVTNFTYDTMNRLIRVVDASAGTTNYIYDAAGNLTKVTDARNNSTTFEYDSQNRLVKTTDPLGKFETFSYDANGNLLSATDRKAQTINFAYDVVNQLIQKTLPGNLVTTFVYDTIGNLTSTVDPDSALGFTYDGASRLTSTATTGSPNQPAVTINYTYDKSGNRLTMSDGISGTTTYTYDALNRFSILDPPSSSPVNFTYDALSRRASTTLPNGVVTNYSYDAASQLSAISHQLSAVPFTSFGYTYDQIGNRITSSVQRSGVSVQNNLSFVYDNLYRLTQATHPLPANPAETFSYDSLGNRLLRDGQSTSAVFDAANRLLSDENFTYSYDANGNLIRKTETATGMVTDYLYDAENQLIQIKTNGVTTAIYSYDGLGRRIQKDVDGTITRYIYDNEDILLEYDGGSTGSPLNTLQARYTHGPGIDEPLVMERGGQNYFYHADGLGSVADLTDSTGTVVQSYVYDSFGNIINQTGSLINPYTYTGREYDPESGLYYYRNRYYDPIIGRFISEDPIGLLGGDNFYTYALGNPIKWVDPWGLQVALPIPTLNPYLLPAIPLLWCALNPELCQEALQRVGEKVCSIFSKDDSKSDKQNPKPNPNNEIPRPNADAAQPPGEGWEWRGNGPPGSDEGAWYNPGTGESLHPDLNHPGPIGPHTDYSGPRGKGRIYPNGRIEWK